jgi:type II secretory pathway pseudopilin PulG
LFLAITILQNNGLPVIFIQSFQRFFGCQGSANVEVIIIIGVLASSMLLVVGNAEDKAEATVIVSDMRSMKSAAILFKLKEGRWPVLASVTNPETGFGGIQLAGDIEIPSLRHLLILSATPAFAERPDQPGNSNPPGRPESPGKSNDAPGRNKDVPASGNEGSAAEDDRSALQKMFGGASLEGFSIREENGHAYLIYKEPLNKN